MMPPLDVMPPPEPTGMLVVSVLVLGVFALMVLSALTLLGFGVRAIWTRMRRLLLGTALWTLLLLGLLIWLTWAPAA
jgi:hypothetical protein